MSETASLNGVRKPPEGAPRGFPPVIDLGLCIARSGNPTFADRQITLVASPRNQISQFLSFALDEFNFFIPSDSVLQARGQSSCYDPFAAPARSARSA
jgi:hypothetical protein